MATDVKKQIADVFESQARRVGLDKVTIGAVVSECHVSRQAFYYYYQDIVDVARFVLKERLTMIWKSGDALDNPKEAVRIFVNELVNQYPFISIAVNSKLRGEMELLLIKELREFIHVIFIRENCGRELTRKQIEFQSDLIACAIAAYSIEHCGERNVDTGEFSELLWDLLRRTYGGNK